MRTLNQSTGDSYTRRPEDAYTARLRTLPVCQCCVVCIWTRLECQGMVELLRNSDRCMRISGFLMKACVTFEP